MRLTYGKPIPRAVWDSWGNYKKVTVNGQTYAKVGDTLYSHHAVDRMQPSGLRYSPFDNRKGAISAISQAGGDYGRSIAPGYVDYVINNATPVYQEGRRAWLYQLGTVQVITNPQGQIITIITQ